MLKKSWRFILVAILAATLSTSAFSVELRLTFTPTRDPNFPHQNSYTIGHLLDAGDNEVYSYRLNHGASWTSNAITLSYDMGGWAYGEYVAPGGWVYPSSMMKRLCVGNYDPQYPHLTDCRDKNGVIGEYVAAYDTISIPSPTAVTYLNMGQPYRNQNAHLVYSTDGTNRLASTPITTDNNGRAVFLPRAGMTLCAGINRNGSIEYDEGQVFYSQLTNTEYVVAENGRPMPLYWEYGLVGPNLAQVNVYWEDLAAVVPGHLDYFFQLFTTSGQPIGSAWTQQNVMSFTGTPGTRFVFRVFAGDTKDRIYALGDYHGLIIPNMSAAPAAQSLNALTEENCEGCPSIEIAAQEPRIVESGASKAIMHKSARNTKFDKVENMKEQGLQFGVKATKKTLPLSAIVVPESTKIDAGALKSK